MSINRCLTCGNRNFTKLKLSGFTILNGKRFQSSKAGTVIGCHKVDESKYLLTENGKLLDEKIGGNLINLLSLSNFKADVGKTRTLFGLHSDYPCITVTGLGAQVTANDPCEERDEKKENIRTAVAAAVKTVQNYDFTKINVDSCGDAKAAGEGGGLVLYTYDDLKSEKRKKVSLNLLNLLNRDSDISEWNNGVILSDSQNYARKLMEMPSNLKPPLTFADMAYKRFSKHPKVNVKIRDEAWAKSMNMNCFLSVGNGSVNPSAFLEIRYKGVDQCSDPVVLIGKGITFDTGGISIKPSSKMALMKGDMGGAACVLGCLNAVIEMDMPINLVVLVPLAENMPSSSATNPGDVFTAMNGKTVEVDNTDAEGRLILADALCYSSHFKPSHVINAATLTGAIDVALGAGAAGTYTTSHDLWKVLQDAGETTGDRLWRMPLYKYYTKQMECSKTADLRNTQKKAGSAGSATAAAFLKEFVETKNWAHLDIAGVMTNEGDVPYLGTGMSGRPTRTLVEAVRILSLKS